MQYKIENTEECIKITNLNLNKTVEIDYLDRTKVINAIQIMDDNRSIRELIV